MVVATSVAGGLFRAVAYLAAGSAVLLVLALSGQAAYPGDGSTAPVTTGVEVNLSEDSSELATESSETESQASSLF